jgi:diaminopimelate epimerase
MLHFVKMHGIGNDYIYIDAFAQEAPGDVPALARRLSDRHTGVGGDGLILIQPSEEADCRMRMFNADGSEGRMCGNAIRCIARYMLERHGDKVAGDAVRIETLSGVKTVSAIRDGEGRVSLLRADMGAPGLTAQSIPVRSDTPQNVTVPFGSGVAQGVCVSMGSPHVVLFVDCDPMELGLERIGAPIERDPLFPERVNVEFVRPLPDGSLQMRVWERGSGETMACGTGACAAAVAAMLTGRVDAREVTVHLRGGDLHIQWDAQSNRVYMTGPAAIVFEGDWLGE